MIAYPLSPPTKSNEPLSSSSKRVSKKMRKLLKEILPALQALQITFRQEHKQMILLHYQQISCISQLKRGSEEELFMNPQALLAAPYATQNAFQVSSAGNTWSNASMPANWASSPILGTGGFWTHNHPHESQVLIQSRSLSVPTLCHADASTAIIGAPSQDITPPQSPGAPGPSDPTVSGPPSPTFFIRRNLREVSDYPSLQTPQSVSPTPPESESPPAVPSPNLEFNATPPVYRLKPPDLFQLFSSTLVPTSLSTLGFLPDLWDFDVDCRMTAEALEAATDAENDYLMADLSFGAAGPSSLAQVAEMQES
ncbi:hypothetical protein H1R20_g1890, partial [Candolleomyces eurysporus]